MLHSRACEETDSKRKNESGAAHRWIWYFADAPLMWVCEMRCFLHKRNRTRFWWCAATRDAWRDAVNCWTITNSKKYIFIHSFIHSLHSQQVTFQGLWFDPELKLDLSWCFACPHVHVGLCSLKFPVFGIVQKHVDIWKGNAKLSLVVCVCVTAVPFWCSIPPSLPVFPGQAPYPPQPWPVTKSLDYSVFASFSSVSVLLCEHTDGSPGIINLHFVIYEGLPVRYPAVSGTAHSGVLW